MSYILKKGNVYCFVDNHNAIHKIQDIDSATKFYDLNKAKYLKNKATKKLKGFKIIQIENNYYDEQLNTEKVKRKSFTSSERLKIYNNSKGRCAICGKFIPYDQFTVDHIIPLSKGGTNQMENLQCACDICNKIKQDILPEDFMDKLVQIILYQMKKNFDENFYRKISYLRKYNKKKRVMEPIKILLKIDK